MRESRRRVDIHSSRALKLLCPEKLRGLPPLKVVPMHITDDLQYRLVTGDNGQRIEALDVLRQQLLAGPASR